MTLDLCSDDSLSVILQEQEDDPRFSSVLDHLSDCHRCQQRLDDLAAHPAVWRNAARYLDNAEEDLCEVLSDSHTLVDARLDTVPVADSLDIQTFLEPPRHPEMLGRIGQYELEREIGRGGMGIVLKGFDCELNRTVAIKLLAPYLASSGTARQRFIREARAAAAVVHENVIAIHGIQTEGTLPSIVMPYVSGPSLQQFIDTNGPLEAIDVVRVGIQIAAGLAAAHSQGVVHRDIKPANIILENGINRVQITDFGLARAAHDVDITRTGIIAGTPAFMSPEQSLSENVDHRSDLFSLGSVLYFAATGRLPFRASTPFGVLQQVCNSTPERPSHVEPRIPSHVDSVIETLLAKSPEDRFDDANELRRWLTQYLAHLQQPANANAPRRLTTPARRKRLRERARKLVTGSAALLLGFFAIYWWRSELLPPVSRTDTAPSQQDLPTSRDLLTTVSNVASATVIDAEIIAVETEVQQLEQESKLGPLHTQQYVLDTQIREADTAVSHLENAFRNSADESDSSLTPRR